MTRHSLADKAQDILERHSKGAPMHYRRLVEIGIEEGLIVPGGPTPEASLNSAITQDIKRRAAKGSAARFRAEGNGYYALARPTDPLRGAVERKNQEVRDRLRQVLGEIHPQAFEQLIGELLLALGFDDVEVTQYTGDRGIDLRGTLVVGGVTDVQTAIQVKRYNKTKVRGPEVRQLRGGLGPHERGLIITLSSFTKDARREAAEPNRSPISLVDGAGLIDLLVDNQVGVASSQVSILELDEGFFTEVSDDEEFQSGISQVSRTPGTRRSSTVQPDKARSIWPLPGGGSAWKDTLDRMIKHVATEAPTMADAIDWLIASYDRVGSEKTTRGYWQVLRSFGLIETQGEQVAVTALGRQYLDDPTEDQLLEIAIRRILGVEEMLEWLAERPHSPDELLERFNVSLDAGWETLAQIQFRLGWLQVLGAAAPNTDGSWTRGLVT